VWRPDAGRKRQLDVPVDPVGSAESARVASLLVWITVALLLIVLAVVVALA
jgi:hypothetical protein